MLEGIWNIKTGGFEHEFRRVFLPVCIKNVASKKARMGLTAKGSQCWGVDKLNLNPRIMEWVGLKGS